MRAGSGDQLAGGVALVTDHAARMGGLAIGGGWRRGCGRTWYGCGSMRGCLSCGRCIGRGSASSDDLSRNAAATAVRRDFTARRCSRPKRPLRFDARETTAADSLQRSSEQVLRVAVYYAPELDDPLWRAGCAWLGRDPETGAEVRQPGVEGIAELTADARAYGFHATLKPPMRLATSYGAFLEDVRRVAAGVAGFEMPALGVAEISGFLAVREMEACPALQALSDAFVEGVDRHRAPADAAELARRRRRRLSEVQEAMLVRWGYPHVFESWFFHMTLTRRLGAGEQASVRMAAEGFFAAALAARRWVGSVCVFTQAGAGAPFLLAERVGLGV